jgi:hypothetical protein
MPVSKPEIPIIHNPRKCAAMLHIIDIKTARSFPATQSFCMLVAPDAEPPFPCTITMPFAVVAVTAGVVRVLLVGDRVTVLATFVKLSVLVVVEVPVVPPLSVPVQLVPAQQQATCPAQS